MTSQSSNKTSVSRIAAYICKKNFDGVDQKVLEEAGRRGNEIHADIENGTFRTEEGKFAEKYLAGRTPKRECQIEPIERGELTITGRFDAFLQDDRELIDYKSEAIADLKYWIIQLNLYAYGLGGADKLTVIHVPKSGNYKVISVPKLSGEQIEKIIYAFANKEELPDNFWDFLGLVTQAEEINLDLVVYSHDIGQIETNVDEIVKQIEEKLKSYVPENYSPENIGLAAKDRAALNKSEKALIERRKALEEKHNEPLKNTFDKIKFAQDLIKKASLALDKVVKAVEEKEKADIRKDLEDYFTQTGFALVSFEKIFKQSWLNKTAKRKETKAEIDAIIKKINLDIELHDRLNEPDAKVFYLQTLDIDSALKKADEIKKAREVLEQAQAKKPDPVVEKVEVVVEKIPVPFVVDKEEIKQGEEILTRRVEIKGTEKQLIDLSIYLDSVGIEWNKI